MGTVDLKKLENLNSHGLFSLLITFFIVSVIFYCGAYSSVSSLLPSSIPVHHDDYSNYATRFGHIALSIRPLSTFLITLLASIDSNLLIWSVRILAITYVFLCLCLFDSIELKRKWWITVFFSVLIFSSPMVVEYARYTGMMTHLISGCLGILAIIYLHRAFSFNSISNAAGASICIFLSVLAKEDFLVLYLFSYGYFLMKSPTSTRLKLVGFAGFLLAAFYVVGIKYFTATQFLGVVTTQSSYFINIQPISIVKTLVSYLSGANHPAMLFHGNAVIVGVIVSILLGLLIKGENASKLFFFLGCAFCIIAPYSVLPNHVNAYYEYLWLPFILFAAYIGINGLLSLLPDNLRGYRMIQKGAVVIQLLIAFYVFMGDFDGRKSVANWYDQQAQTNDLVLSKIQEQAKNMGPFDKVCVIGANTFSPWYMHGATYLSNVLGLKNKWIILQPENTDALPGFQMGAGSSRGLVSVDPNINLSKNNCSKVIDLKAINNV